MQKRHILSIQQTQVQWLYHSIPRWHISIIGVDLESNIVGSTESFYKNFNGSYHTSQCTK